MPWLQECGKVSVLSLTPHIGFESLLGINDFNCKLDDILVESAVMLMNKFGDIFLCKFFSLNLNIRQIKLVSRSMKRIWFWNFEDAAYKFFLLELHRSINKDRFKYDWL